jgi:hypothetical protein
MHGSSVSYSIDLWVPNNEPLKLRKDLSRWIETRDIFRKNELIYEDENIIQIKHEVTTVRGSFGFTWTPKDMATYNLTFLIQNDLFKIDALIEFPQSKDNSILGLVWKIRCSDFLLGFFKQIELGENTRLLKELYPKEDLNKFLKITWDGLRKAMYFYHGFFSLASIISARAIKRALDF